jgi:erythromycin esterase-like protein
VTLIRSEALPTEDGVPDEHTGSDGQEYGFAAAFGAGDSCEREVIEQLVDLQRHAVAYARRDGLPAEDDLFYAEQNAQVVRAAEKYYRTAHKVCRG